MKSVNLLLMLSVCLQDVPVLHDFVPVAPQDSKSMKTKLNEVTTCTLKKLIKLISFIFSFIFSRKVTYLVCVTLILTCSLLFSISFDRY